MDAELFTFTQEHKKNLSAQEQTELTKAFKNYDKNGDGTMDCKEFKNIMIDLGHRKTTDADAQAMLTKHDKNSDGVISWTEFVLMMIAFKGDQGDKFGKIMDGVASIETKGGGKHQYSAEEVATFSNMINECLKEDEDVKDRLPIQTTGDDLFHILDDGIVLCKLVMVIDPECIDRRAMNIGKNLNAYQVSENLKLGFAACKGSLGLKMIGVGPTDFIQKIPHLILGVVWRVVRQIAVQNIQLKECPEIMRLAEEGETLQDLMKLPPETILIRWVNYHLAKNGQERRIKNLGKDTADSFAMYHVLNRLDKDQCSLQGIDNEDLNGRADNMIDNSKKIGVPEITSGKAFAKGNDKVNTLFISYVFNTKHGLEELTKEEYEAVGLIDDDIEASKEERMFTRWINTLGIDGVFVTDLVQECKDGVLLNQVIDKIKPGSVDWKMVRNPPKNDFDRNNSNNHAVKTMKDSFGKQTKLVGIGGVDISKGERKLVLATIWQLVRVHYLSLIGDKTEDDIVAWGNQLVAKDGVSIKNMKDKDNLSSCIYLIKICAAIEPRAVNPDLVTPGETDADKKLNAMYAISLARKLNAIIFCVWEDMVNVNPKQIFIFMATMMDIHANYKPDN